MPGWHQHLQLRVPFLRDPSTEGAQATMCSGEPWSMGVHLTPDPFEFRRGGITPLMGMLLDNHLQLPPETQIRTVPGPGKTEKLCRTNSLKYPPYTQPTQVLIPPSKTSHPQIKSDKTKMENEHTNPHGISFILSPHKSNPRKSLPKRPYQHTTPETPNQALF